MSMLSVVEGSNKRVINCPITLKMAGISRYFSFEKIEYTGVWHSLLVPRVPVAFALSL